MLNNSKFNAIKQHNHITLGFFDSSFDSIFVFCDILSRLIALYLVPKLFSSHIHYIETMTTEYIRLDNIILLRRRELTIFD